MTDFNPNDVGVANGNIFGLPYSLEESEIVIIPVATDITCSFNKGTAKAPQRIIEASLQVDFVSQKEATFTIVNMLGQQVAKGNLSNTLEVGNLESGIYLLNATIDGQTITKRFIKE